MEKIIFPGSFTYSTIGFTIRLKSAAIFPKFKGSLFRGVLGKAMHDLSCQRKHKACNDSEERWCQVIYLSPVIIHYPAFLKPGIFSSAGLKKSRNNIIIRL
jgi:hypothetical protein